MAKAISNAHTAKIQPFKTRKTKTAPPVSNDTISPPPEVAQAVDLFREFQEQAKHFEGEMTIYKDTIMGFSEEEYSKRVLKGVNKSFRVMGEQTMVTFVVMDASAGLTEEDVEEFEKRWGKKAAGELIGPDYSSIKFDPKVLEANYDQVVTALQTLPAEILDNLFRPMLMKARPGAVETARHYAKTPSEIREIIKQLKMKNYIR